MDRIETVESDFTPGGGWHAAAQLWTRRSGFTGLFCANDEMAVGAMSYFRQAGISVPDDVSVVGYDDIDAAWRTAPMLSTVRIPWEAMTRNAVRWMINVCYGAEVRIERTFPVSLTIRESISYAPDQFASKG